ncbi:MAG: ABC transporter substrate-binding protein [Lachnospiraceae bacterium]|nr:ABC transporter substrate-binding protein [Lachnospiraceae bacterium]
MRKKVSILMSILVLVTVVLGGCSDGDNQTGKDTSNGSSQTQTQNAGGDETSTGDAVYGGSIVVGITQDLDSLDPHKAVAAGTKEVLYNIFEGLVKADKDGNLVPALAESYTISPDGSEYTFVLRDGVKFHNGDLVTAEDVIYSLKRCSGLLTPQEEGVVIESALSAISDIIKVDEKTVKVVMGEPSTELIGYFTCSIIPEDYKEQDTKPVGTGPFCFESYTPLTELVMTKNPDYYLEGKPYLDKVTFKISANTDAAFMELMAGTIDIFPYLTAEQASQLKDTYTIMEGSMNLVQALFLNNAEGPLADVRVRQALCYATDRQAVIDMVAGGRGHVIGSNMFPSFTQYYDAELETYYEYNTEKAKELLAEAGYADGFTFTITVPSNYQFHVETAQVLVEQYRQIGVEAKIQLIEWGSWLSDVYQGRNYEATVVGLDAELVPSDILKRYRSNASNNFLNYKNTEVDELFAKAFATVKDEEKETYYKEIQRLLTEDAASVYIQAPALLVAVNPNLGGYTFYPVYVQDMASVYYIGEAQVNE